MQHTISVSHHSIANLDKGQHKSVTFIELKKEFDTVDRQILLQKLRVCGLAGKEISWFQFYLDNRKEGCKVNGHMLKLENINFGVPRGSWLGPLLFDLYQRFTVGTRFFKR